MATNSSYKSQRDSRGSSAEGPRSRKGLSQRGLRFSRYMHLYGLFILALLIIVIRLGYIQNFEADKVVSHITNKGTLETEILAKRGTIYDRNGKILAVSLDCVDVECDPQLVKYKNLTASILAKHLGGSINEYMDKLEAEGRYSLIKREVDDEVMRSLKEELATNKLTGIFYVNSVKRTYPYGKRASQIIGLLDDQGKGLTGLELYYNEELKGQNGKAIYESSGYADINFIIAGTRNERIPPRDGTDIVLSIDIDIQAILEEAIESATKQYKAEMGMAMVCDPKTGEILAACSTPYLDPNDRSSVDAKATQLRMVSESYEPGSMFKVFTAAIGMSAGIFDDQTTFEVPPVVLVGSDSVRDEDGRDTTDYMSTSDIITHSSNVGAVLLGHQIGAQLFSQGIAQFGIGEPTGIDYPGEALGTVTSLPNYLGEDGLTTLGSMSFGQSIAVPMVQIVRGVGALAYDGRITTPHFLLYKGDERVEWPEPKRATSRYAAELTRQMMERVVAEGTGTNAQMSGFSLAGKTGTGEQVDPTTGTYRENYFLSSFVGFGPTENPELLCYVGLLGTSHLAATSAVPTFTTIMDEALTQKGVTPTKDAILGESSDPETSEGI